MTSKVRHDIQVLRGVAVLAVLFFHANLLPISGGYLGVDLFFVISGFLITSIILNGLADRTFSFSKFYIRRAKRLLPAAYVTLFVTTLLSSFLLTRSEWNDFLDQLFGSLTFTSNFILMFQTGYFQSQAESKPLLHMWSLSLEEQYYIVMPMLLSVFALKNRIWVLSILFIASLAGCLALMSGGTFLSSLGLSVTGAQKISFYMLPLRAWELLAGSVCAWLMIQKPNLEIPRLLKISAFTTIVAISLFPTDLKHPGTDAIIVVIAASVMLLGNSDWLRPGIISKPLAFVGDISYSLYLVHWPLFAFAFSIYLGPPPKQISALLVVLSCVLAYLQFNFVEQRYRHQWNLPSKFAAIRLSVATLVLFATPLAFLSWNQDVSDHPDFAEIRKANKGFGNQCEQLGASFEQRHDCATSELPVLAIWGDSFAMHLIPGLAKDPSLKKSLIQITKSSCGPIIGLAQIQGKYTKEWAQACMSFNQSAVEYMIREPSIKYILMGSPFTAVFRNDGQKFYHENQIAPFDLNIAERQFSHTIETLRAAGKTPIIVAPPPSEGFDIGACLEREHDGAPIWGRKNCSISESSSIEGWKDVNEALSRLEQSQNLKVFRPSQVLCADGSCETKINGTYLYRDGGHLSASGSSVVIKLLGIADFINSDLN